MVDQYHTGQQFGNYTLTRLLGTGGFAEVYLGEHIYLKSQAAIKVLLTSLGTEEMDYFRTEARTLATLKHPHIVRILDFGIERNVPFLVMEYAPKGTVQQRYPRGVTLAPEAIAPYVTQIASALQYAHDQKLIHRDIKPGNMLIQEDDTLLLSDFGVAMFAQSTRQQSRQEFVGTATYMAPEQLRGKACQASDQYALGVVVYEWLSGGFLFQGSFTEVCAQHMFAPPEPLRTRIPALSPQIEEVVMTALAKDPAQRFPNVAAFASALEQACRAGRLTSITSESPFEATTKDTAQPDTRPEELSTTQNEATSPPNPQHATPDATTQPDPAPTVAIEESLHTPVAGAWTANQTLSRTLKNIRRLSPRGIITLLVLMAVVLSGSGLLYYTYAASNRPVQHRDVATQQVPTRTSVAQQTQTPADAATSTAHQSVVDIATPTPAPQIVPTPTPGSVSSPTAEPTPTPTSVPTPKPTSIPKPTCPPMIQSGSKGTWVKTLQQDMNARGMKDSAGKALVVDGEFGSATQYAVKQWQKKEKIEVDGVVGPQTWHSLGRC